MNAFIENKVEEIRQVWFVDTQDGSDGLQCKACGLTRSHIDSEALFGHVALHHTQVGNYDVNGECYGLVVELLERLGK